MKRKEFKIKEAEYAYTGGGIYVIVGELENGNFFMHDASFYDTRILTERPDFENDDVWYPEWQEEHLIEDLNTKKDGAFFFLQAYKWIKKNIEGYDKYLDYIAEDAEKLKSKSKRR